MKESTVKRLIWLALLCLIIYGIGDLFYRYAESLEIKYLASMFFSLSIGFCIFLLQPGGSAK
jgi:hypothetical protein